MLEYPPCSTIDVPQFMPRPERPEPPVQYAVGFPERMWEKGQTLRVSFLHDPHGLRGRIEDLAREWLKYAKLNFDFTGPDRGADVRIAFEPRGHWSAVGRDSQMRNQFPNQSMNLALNGSERPDYFRSTVLHEFGHALGMIHEHLSPGANIHWNVEAVYRYYGGPPNNWSRATIDNNMFRRPSMAITDFTRFDEKSIMLYPIPREHTLDGFSVGINSELSTLDIQFISKHYPGRVIEPPPPKTVALGQAVDGAIEQPGQRNRFKLTVDTEGAYVIRTLGDLDTVMALYESEDRMNKSGLIMDADDDGLDRNARIATWLTKGVPVAEVWLREPTDTGRYTFSFTRFE